MNIIYGETKTPTIHKNYTPVYLTEETMENHKYKVLASMKDHNLDALLVYGDREHGGAFSYLTGFEPRFEEAVLVLHKNGDSYLLLGNENMKMARYSFLKGTAIHVPHFSLPCQPMDTGKTMKELIAQSGINNGMSVGCAGWKYFTSYTEDNLRLFDIPSFILEAVQKNNPVGKIVNASEIFVHPNNGVRIRNNANEIAHYEFGAGLASAAVYEAMEAVRPGVTEMEVAEKMITYGQPLTVTTICASGERFTNAVVFPRNKKIEIGHRFSLTIGLRGGLSSRTAYVANDQNDIPTNEKDYLDKVAIPYYRAAISWYENIGIGISGREIYELIEDILPKEQYGWTLNPGHYTGNEEWISSPFGKKSTSILDSGMLLQMDIIPAVAGYGGAGVEDGIVLADESLRRKIEEDYPHSWSRMMVRKKYMKEILGISLKEEVLPLSDICGYFRPFLLNHGYALRKSGT